MTVSLSIITAMCLFSLSMSISPGPVNMLALSTGVNHGFRKAVPFVSGATIGFTLLLFLIGLGLGQIATTIPYLMETLGFAGAAFICYIGVKIFQSDSKLERGEETSSSFLHGALLQWLNPKAWIACLSGVSAFNLVSLDQLSLFTLLYFAICYRSIACWALVGDKISRVLSTEQNLKRFNRVMGGGLVMVGGYLGVMNLA